MKALKNSSVNQVALAYIQIVFGCIMGALAYPLFLVPNSIAPGGVTGLATVINYLWGFPVGITSLLLNIPLFFIGYHSMGKRFVIRTLFATVLFSLCIDAIKLDALTDDSLLASFFGGALLGFGLAFILRGGATSGGTDLIAKMVHKRFPVITVGLFLFIIDFTVVLIAGLTMSMQHAMYAAITVFVCSKALDFVVVGISMNKVCYIISDEFEKIKHRILHEMERGVTVLNAKGGYSGEKVSLLLCVVNRIEIISLKEIVWEEDEGAFMFVTDTHETLGEGFLAWNEE
ncbi:MAG TPA: YitT family protein [Christensenellaceae bacterium]|nr:YitT family protein [Christensenellaceae bacterium]